MSIPIFCINLIRATERKEKIKKEWIDRLGLKIVFWEACDRRNISNFLYIYDKNAAKIYVKRPLSEGEIACAISFYSLYDYLLKNNYEEVIIMEDDITPLFDNKSELFVKIQQGKLEFPEACIMLLHQYPNYSVDASNGIIKKNFSMCYESPWGNQLFYINKEGLKKVHNLLKIIKFPADYPQKLLSKEKKVIITNQPLCDHIWYGESAITYIGNDFRNTSRKFIE